MNDAAKGRLAASPITFLEKRSGYSNPTSATKTAIKRADAKKPGISRLPHHTHVFRKDHPARGFSRRAD
ncbi:hypothetical protein GRW89_20690 [Pseudomonas moraviensis]|uniref:hypothetical protein n=1 Tax=Pseudomonas moraviensis TaxID=321662 RepID=UPI00135E37DB|nr:hypothetical protein [Pseudomonas moraviensis]MXI48926.1 hypothetical protein [Pseudomonas moraviensis]